MICSAIYNKTARFYCKVSVMQKVCTQCGVTKDFSEFHSRRKQGRLGIVSQCKSCDYERSIRNIKKRGPLYYVWTNMKRRCYDEKCHAFKDYGGRGIKVHKDWHCFETFQDWSLKSGFRGGLQLDRIDNNGDYSSVNCRFVDSKQNNRNKRSNKLDEQTVVKLLLCTKSTREVATDFNISYDLAWKVRKGKLWADVYERVKSTGS